MVEAAVGYSERLPRFRNQTAVAKSMARQMLSSSATGSA